jgi:hypothetical protein
MSFTRIRHLAAQAAAKTLHELGFSCAIFGSFACKLYGNNRIPNVSPIYLSPYLDANVASALVGC